MRCPGGIQLEFPLFALSLAVCLFCAVPTGYFLSSVNQIQGILVQFTNTSLTRHYGVTLSTPTLLFAWGCIVASGSVGACTFAWLAYPLKRRFGCKQTLFLLGCGSTFVASIAECFARYADSVELFIFAMVLGSMSVVWTLHVVGPTYLSECSPPGARGFTSMFVCIGVYAGALLASVVGLPGALGTEALWGIYCLLPAAFSGTGILVSHWLPDSPKDLYTTLNDKPRARKNVSFLYGEEHHNVDEVLGDFHEEHGQTKAIFKLSHLITERHLRRALIVTIWADVLAACSGPFVVLYFSTAIFLNLGLSASVAASLTIALSPPLLLLTPVAAVLIERLGRRRMVLHFGAVMIAALSVYVVCGTLAVRAFPDANWLKYVAVVGLSVNFWLAPLGPPVIAPFVPTELFPQHARTAGMVIVSVVLAACCTIEIAVLPLLLNLCGPLAILVVFIGPSVVALGALWRTMPETAGKPVNLIVREFIDEAETREVANSSDDRNYGSIEASRGR